MRVGAVHEAAGGGTLAVLAVDDRASNLDAVTAVLEEVECTVVCARSGHEALELFSRQTFSVVLLDVQMPGMDGYQVAHSLRSNDGRRDVPIIFMTGTEHARDDVLKGYGSGAVDYLHKPIDADVLCSKVRVFLELAAARRAAEEANVALERNYAELRETSLALREAHGRLRAAYDQLRETQAQLVHSAKMASLGELVAGIAHEINNPLAFTSSHLATTQESLGAVSNEVKPCLSEAGAKHWARASERLSGMRLGLERISDLVVKLRTFSRKDEEQLKVISVKESVDAVLTILGHRLSSSIRVELELGEPDRIECYAMLFNQAVLNLIANALDAIEGTGAITIRAGRSCAHYEISVIDDGRGIPDDIRERVLEPFFTTKDVGEGTGLGLPITYGIARQHGGELELGPAPGGGTMATIRIPLTESVCPS